MKNKFLIIFGAVVASALSFYFVTAAEAQRQGPYMLVAHSNQSARVGIFRLDTSSGQVSFCYVSDGRDVAVQCSRAVD